MFTQNVLQIIDIFRTARAEAWKKGIPCIWYKYSTPMTWNNCNLSGSFSNGVLTSFTPTDITINTSEIDRSALLVTVPDPSLQFFWTTKTSSITHQGMAGAWIIL
jgi:hypothetical protein